MKVESPKVMNILLAHVRDKGLKIYKHNLMKAQVCKMRVFCKWTQTHEARGKVHKKKGSDFIIGTSIKWTEIFL